MDLTSFLFLAIIVVLGGVIADLADRLGRKLGKKRLSLFGLRPRHTAEVITVGAGILIPLFTIFVLYVFSSDVRSWIREGPRIVQERDQLNRDVARLREERESLTTDRHALQVEIGNLKEQQRNQLANLKETRKLVQELTDQRSKLEKSIQEYQARVSDLTGRIRLAAERLKNTEADLSQTKQLLVSSKKEVDELRPLSQELARQRSELTEQNRKLILTNASLEDDNAKLESDRTTLQNSIQDLDQKYADKTKELEDSERDLELKKIQLDSARAELDRVSRQLSQMMQLLQVNVDVSRTRPMTYAIGEEVTRLAVPPSLTEDQARDYLTTLLREARIDAEQRGAKSPNPNLPSAGIWTRDLPNGQQLTIEDQEKEIIKSIAGKKDSCVLIAYSSLNAFQGEFVSLDVKSASNPIVYRQGQTIAEMRIDSGASEDYIFTQITNFLQKDVSERAEKDKLIPYAGRDIQFGELTTLDLLNLVRAIKNVGGRVRLIAYADTDTRAAGPLKLQFRLR